MLNIAVLAALGAALSHTLFRNGRIAFIMELPLYHAPNPRTIGLFMWSHTWAFLRRASTMILAVSTAVWLLAYFLTAPSARAISPGSANAGACRPPPWALTGG